MHIKEKKLKIRKQVCFPTLYIVGSTLRFQGDRRQWDGTV